MQEKNLKINKVKGCKGCKISADTRKIRLFKEPNFENTFTDNFGPTWSNFLDKETTKNWYENRLQL